MLGSTGAVLVCRLFQPLFNQQSRTTSHQPFENLSAFVAFWLTLPQSQLRFSKTYLLQVPEKFRRKPSFAGQNVEVTLQKGFGRNGKKAWLLSRRPFQLPNCSPPFNRHRGLMSDIKA